MPGRQDWDRPATVIAAVLGLLVLAGSLPFTVIAFNELPENGGGPGPATFDVAWKEAALASGSAQIQDGTQTAKAVVQANGTLAGVSVRVAPGDCTDTANAQLQQAKAQATWKLEVADGNGTRTLGSGSFTCPDGLATQSFKLAEHAPDIAAATTGNATQVQRQAPQQRATLTLTLSWTRSGGPLPGLPNNPLNPTFSAKGTVDVTAYSPTVTAHQAEVSR